MALTKYEEGSLKELWVISLPLLLSSFSVMSMIFTDRLFLAHYSFEAFNATVKASTLGWTFLISWIILTGIAEVFVAQYNGSNQKSKLGEPVWQMIWLSLTSFIFFFPLSFWGAEFFYGHDFTYHFERDYFSWMMLFGPIFPLGSALTSFFVGRGKMGLVTCLAIFSNLLNIILDPILIFGIEGVVPSLGVKGAAIATNIGGFFQVAVLAFFFLKKTNRQNFGTGQFKIVWSSMLNCIRVGLPVALFVTIEVLGFAAFYFMMSKAGERYITVAGVCQSIILLFFFVADGISKGAMTIAGNLIGSKKTHLVPKVLISGLKLHLIFFVILLILYTFFSDAIIYQFISHSDPNLFTELKETLHICLLLMTVYLLFEGIRMLIYGVLSAAGDTMFLLVGGSISLWLLLVVPVYFFILLKEAPVITGSLLYVVYSVGASVLYIWRFTSNKWKSITIAA